MMDEVLDDLIVETLLSSSSSSSSSSSMRSSTSSSYTSTSSDSELEWMNSDDNEDALLLKIINDRECNDRVQDFIQTVVHNYSDEQFRKNFRLSRIVAYKLIDMYQQSSHYKSKLYGGRKAISAESQCLAFLWFAANKSTFREVSNLFNVTQSVAHTHMTCILQFLFEISPQIIKFPTTVEEKAQKANEFEQVAGFPDVIGCIDGCYIYIRKPAHKVRSTYVNRHGLISITLQGICDAKKKFIDAFVGCPSRVHDSRVYKLSPIYKKIPEICGEKYHILGDAAYPLREHLITPFKDYGNLTGKKRIFNKKHCQTRVKIENCFGLLKQRFRQLIRLDFLTVQKMSKFILACCVLHNLCIDNGDSWDEADTTDRIEEDLATTGTEASDEITEPLSDAVLRHLGENKRIRIMDKF